MKTEKVFEKAAYAADKEYLDNLDKVFEAPEVKESSPEDEPISRQLSYGFSQGTMSFGNLGRVISSGYEAITKPGDFELHSKLNEIGRQLDIQEEYPEFTGITPDKYTTAMTVGEVSNYVLDPVNIAYAFLPGGMAVRAGQFAAYEGGLETLRQTATKGKITDPTSIAITAAVAGGASLGLDAALRGFSKEAKELIEESSERITKTETSAATKIETPATSVENLEPITTQADHVRAWWRKSLEGQQTELSQLRQRAIDGEDIPQADFVRAFWKASGVDKDKLDVAPVLSKIEVEAVKESVASLKTPAKNLSFDELNYQERLIQISKVDNILKKLEKRLSNPRYNSSKITAKIAQIKTYKSKLQQNIDTDAMSLVTSKADAVVDTIEDLAAKDKLSTNIFASLMAEAVRPLVGAAGGGVVGNMFDDDGDHNWMYWGMFAGAGVGHLSRRLNNSTALTDIQKANGDLVINEAYHSLAGRAMAKLKIMTASTQATKMDAAGGWSKVIGNKLFSRIATGDAYSLEAKVQRLHSDFFARLNSVVSLPEAKNILQQAGKITEKSVLQMNEANRTVNTIAGEIMRGFTDINSLKAGYTGLAGDLKPLTQEQLITIREAVSGYKEQLGYVKGLVEEAGIPFKDLGEDYGLPQLWNIEKADKDYFTFVKDLEEAIQIQKANGGKELSADNFATNVTTKPAFRDTVQSRRSDFFNRDPETGLTTFRKEAVYFENTRQLTDKEAVKFLAEKGWLKLDAQEVLTEYGLQTIKVAEFAKTFGPNGEVINLALDRTRKAFQEQARNLSPKEAQRLSSERETYENLIVNGIEAFWGRYGKPLQGEVGQTATTAVRTLQALANMKYLTTVAIANLPDLLQPFINSSFGTAAKVALQRPSKSFARQGNFKYDNTWERELMNFTSGGMIDSRGQAFLANTQDMYFKLVGLKTVTNVSRNFAYDVGVNRAYNLAKKAKLSKAELNEVKTLGLTKDDLTVIRKHKTIDEAYGDTSGANVFLDIAGRQSADRDAIIPLMGNRLLFTQHHNPFIRSMGQFLSWTMGKSAQLNKILSRVEDGDARLALKMLATVPVYAGLREMKGFLNPSASKDPYEDEDYIDKALRGLKISGQTSNWAIDKIAESLKYNISSRDNFTGGFSPAMGYMEESIKALARAAGEDDFEDAAKKVGETIPIVSQALDVAEKYSVGGEVEVPNASPEPDERIDKMTGLPYNLQAGIPYRDEEDPLKRLGLAGGGTVQGDPLKRMGFGLGGGVYKLGKALFKSLGDDAAGTFETTAAKNLADVTPEGSVDNVAKSLDEKFQGTLKVQHASSEKNLKEFIDPSEVKPSARYPENEFGDNAVYFGEKDSPFTDPEGMYMYDASPYLYNVEAVFDKAFVLTPKNIKELASLIPEDKRNFGGKVADVLKDKGYDGLIIKGFDDSRAAEKAVNKATKKDKFFYGIFQDQVISFDPKKNKILGDAEVRSGIEGRTRYIAENMDEEDIAAWQEANKLPESKRQAQRPEIIQSLQQVLAGKKSIEEHNNLVDEVFPPVFYTKENAPEFPTLVEVKGAVGKKTLTGGRGLIADISILADGRRVSSRLDIPAYDQRGVWAVTLHEPGKGGKAFAYGQSAVLKNVEFTTNPKDALDIAMGQAKGTIARIEGNWVDHNPYAIYEKALDLLDSDEWVQVGMNPYKHSYFYDKATMKPLKSASEVIQVGPLVLAKKDKDLIYANADDFKVDLSPQSIKGKKKLKDQEINIDSVSFMEGGLA